MSWGAAEFSGESGYNSYFTTPTGHANVSFIASAGDTGAITEWPAVSSNVVAVGGTQLTIADSAGTYGNETAWSGSGGGVSQYEAKPPFQSGVTQSNTNRASPDVAWDASPSTGVSVYFSGQSTGSGAWYTFGGTSVGAPSWAGVIAIADQGRALAGQSPLDGPSQLLPALYSLPSSDFHDITTGTAASGSKSNSTGTGYDLVTGRGTPYADLVVAGLVSWNSTSPPSPPPVPPVGTPTLTATAVNTTTARLSWNSVSGSPQGYRIYKIIGSTTTLVVTVSSSTTSYQVNGLTPGSRVSFKVEAYNSSSIADSQIVALTMPVPPPVVGTPTLTARTLSSTGALLTWNPVSGSPQGYRIYKIIGSTTTLVAIVSASTTSYQVNGLTAGSRVSFKLEAYNSSSIADSQIVALTMPPAPPVVGAPTLTARAANSTTALLSWNAVSGSPQGYRIYKISGSNTTLLATVSTSTTAYQVTGLTAGLSVSFKVEAYNSNSIADSRVVALAMPVPAPPTTPQVRVTAVTRTSAVLSWNAVSGAQAIRIYLLNGSQRVLLGTYGSSTTTVQLTGMAAGSTYKFMVEAYNGSAIADSAWISVITSR
jgi:subtilase family serine protease